VVRNEDELLRALQSPFMVEQHNTSPK